MAGRRTGCFHVFRAVAVIGGKMRLTALHCEGSIPTFVSKNLRFLAGMHRGVCVRLKFQVATADSGAVAGIGQGPFARSYAIRRYQSAELVFG
jgi:hypothetical protein